MLGKNMLEMHNALNAPRASIADDKWLRPESWIDLSDCPEGSIYMMVANWYDEGATTCFRAQENMGGPILVDWGDGTVEEFQNSSLPVSHTYQAGDGEWIGEGFLGLKITITPVITGRKITYFSIQNPYSDKRINYYANIVSVYINSSFLSGLTRAFGARLTQKVFNYLLEEVVVKNAAGLQTLEEAFINCINLRKVQIEGAQAFKLTNASYAFYGCSSLTDINAIDFSKADVTYAFYGCSSIKKFPDFNFTANVLARNFQYAFYGCSSIKNFEDFPPLPLTNSYFVQCFTNCTSLENIDNSFLENAANLYRTFKGCSSLKSIGNISNEFVTTMFETFMDCVNLTDVGDITLPEITTAKSLFEGCKSLRFIGEFTAVKNLTAERMFYNCSSLVEINSFDIALVTAIDYMFYACSSLQKIPDINAKPTSATYAFYGCGIKTTPVIDLSNCTTVTLMFSNCSLITTSSQYNLDLVNTFTSLFSGCYNLLTIPQFNYSLATNGFLTNMLNGCTLLTGNLDFSSCTAAYTTAVSFSGFKITGLLMPINFKHNLNISNCLLDANALNALFTGLPTTTSSSKTITITGNPGAATCDRSIATNKGWVISG